MDKVNFDETKILEALSRSGYLFESEISKNLTTKGYFVESNKSIIDKLTGKSREIDLIAEYDKGFDRDYSQKCSSKIILAFEIKNNSSPLILLTEYQNSINDEIWEAIKSFVTIPNGLEYYNFDLSESFIYHNPALFTQYCSFQEKKGSKDLMASHPDNIHSGIQKITQYCQEQVNLVEDDENNYLRHWIYLPVLLISEELYELRLDENNIPKISKTEEATLIYNYHHNNEPSSCLVKIVTKLGLDSFLNSMLLLENNIESNMIDLRKKQKI